MMVIRNKMVKKRCHINIVTYNIFCRPSFACYDEQIKRATRIPDAISKVLGNKFEKVDVVCFVECFDHDVNDILTIEMHKKGFKYSTNILHSYSLLKLKLINGGIRIFSRHKILRSEFRMFSFSGFTELESYIGKGALAIKISVNGVICHIIGTHLAAWKSGESARHSQINVIKDFIDDMKYADIVKKNEPVIVTGDFNINALSKQNYSNLKLLKTYKIPNKSIKNLICNGGSYSTNDNNLIGRDGECRKNINELLDYSLLVKSKQYKMKKYVVNIIKPYMGTRHLRSIFYKDTGLRSKNLSDHFPNLTKIVVELN